MFDFFSFRSWTDDHFQCSNVQSANMACIVATRESKSCLYMIRLISLLSPYDSVKVWRQHTAIDHRLAGRSILEQLFIQQQLIF
jgi:hypothetical protein